MMKCYLPFVLFSYCNMCCARLILQDLAEIVGALASLISEVQEDVKNCKNVWNRVFVR